MSLIVRRTRKAIWAAGAVDDERRRRAISELARSDDDTDGLSVYEIADERERELVIAATACARGNDEGIDFLELPKEEVERHGAITATPGATPVPAANELHRVLDWAPAQLERMALDLLEGGATVERYSRTFVRRALCGLEPSVVEGDAAAALLARVRSRG